MGSCARQTQFPAQRLPPGGGVGADQSLFQQRSGPLVSRKGPPGPLSSPCGAPQRRRGFAQHGGGILHAQLASLPPLRLRRSRRTRPAHRPARSAPAAEHPSGDCGSQSSPRPGSVIKDDARAAARRRAAASPGRGTRKSPVSTITASTTCERALPYRTALHHDDLPHTGLHRLPASSRGTASLRLVVHILPRLSSADPAFWASMTAV